MTDECLACALAAGRRPLPGAGSSGLSPGWLHLGGLPGHIHYVVQPVTRQQMAAYEAAAGPGLQVAMSRAQAFPDEAEVARLAGRPGSFSRSAGRSVAGVGDDGGDRAAADGGEHRVAH